MTGVNVGPRVLELMALTAGVQARFHALFKANRRHGLQLKPEDKRKAVREALADPEWGAWSDRRIAEEKSVPHPFVAKVRAELTGDVSRDEPAGERRYTIKHGTTAVMNTSNIGRRAVEPGSTPTADDKPRFSVGNCEPLRALPPDHEAYPAAQQFLERARERKAKLERERERDAERALEGSGAKEHSDVQ